MNHTKEPWRIESAESDDPETQQTCVSVSGEGVVLIGKILRADGERLVACVNGCAGLNPAAYRQVVEKHKANIEGLLQAAAFLDNLKLDMAKHSLETALGNCAEALALAEGQP